MRVIPQRLLAVLLLGIALVATPAWSNEYDIELAVFVNKTAPAKPGIGLESDREATLDRKLEQWFERTGSVLALPVTVGKMSELVRRLRESPGYEVIQHTTWREEVQLISEAPFVDVSALSLGEESVLRGVVRFYHSPLLYVDVLLRYRPFDDPLPLLPQAVSTDAAESVPAGPGSYFLEEKRRLKLKEIHYLDHPRFGAIISVWPIEGQVE